MSMLPIWMLSRLECMIQFPDSPKPYKNEIMAISHFNFDPDELENKKKNSEKIYTVVCYVDSEKEPADPQIVGNFRLYNTAIKFMNRAIRAEYRNNDVIEKCNDNADDPILAYQIVRGETYYVFMIFEKDIIID